MLDKRLAEADYLAGDEYSIADIITFPGCAIRSGATSIWPTIPNVKRWHDAIAARPAVQRGVAVLAREPAPGPMTDAEREVMFGKTQFAAR